MVIQVVNFVQIEKETLSLKGPKICTSEKQSGGVTHPVVLLFLFHRLASLFYKLKALQTVRFLRPYLRMTLPGESQRCSRYGAIAKAGGAVAFHLEIMNDEEVVPVTGSFNANFFCPPQF
jgi:hypothetical protein